MAAVLLTGAAAPSVKVRNLRGEAIDPLRTSPPAAATVLIFISTECPYSNRSAPEIQRVIAKFVPAGVRFWLVYPNRADTPDLIRSHLKGYGYQNESVVLRDPEHALVAIGHPKVTPEAAVFDKSSTLTYHGRIDDRFLELGRERPTAQKHDLEDALAATLAGRPVVPESTPAVGCFIADFR